MLSSSGGASDGPDDAGKRRREAIRAAAKHPLRTLRPMADIAQPSEASSRPTTKEDPATVFISYARNDMETVAHVIEGLRSSGGHVTWDQDFIGGMDFEQAICNAIDAARSVIVVWSPVSVQSPFVRDEARRALRANKLITTHIAGFDAAAVPLGFGHLHTIPVDNQELVRKSLAGYGVVLPA
jgi:hypothetical protein